MSQKINGSILRAKFYVLVYAYQARFSGTFEATTTAAAVSAFYIRYSTGSGAHGASSQRVAVVAVAKKCVTPAQ